MPPRYYSFRTGKRKADSKVELALLKDLFAVSWKDFLERGGFDEAFGYECVDAGWVPGTAGHDVDLFVFKNLRRKNLWPISKNLSTYDEDDLFDMIEFLYDHVSEGIAGTEHNYGNCGMHWEIFDKGIGQAAFRKEVNGYLADYGRGYELSADGEVVEKGDIGVRNLLEAKIPENQPRTVKETVAEAVRLFRSRHSSKTDRQNAVRMLAGVLEQLSRKLNKVITKKDESDLFNIANNLAIRHDNDIQKREYDVIWLTWMFYFYLATIHAVVHRLEKAK